ncbi:hypothetical protein L3X38_043242 [Prunus dulcis]|uniref:Uncharacterized protein n=1 Tax=Prunus dulcis TaxID=3755 RepID=A0AAD4UXS4_PRUDU|nr:hypothetical protein L3X38_043242 [Prunus dulcis]
MRNHTSITEFGRRRRRRDGEKAPVRTSRARGRSSWFPTGKTGSKGQANYHNARDDQVLVDEKDPVEEGQDEQLASSNIKWDLSGILCAHGIAAIHYKGGKAVEDYVHSYYSKDGYMALYNNLIMPINGS